MPCFRWGEAFITELMAGSKKRPLLSGYYRLMEMALQLYSQSGRLRAETQFEEVQDIFGEGPTSSALLSCMKLAAAMLHNLPLPNSLVGKWCPARA